MALGDPYIEDGELATYLATENPGDLDLLGWACQTATSAINEWCGRQFNKTDDASERTFDHGGGRYLWVDDFYSLDDLAIEDEWSTVWDAENYTVLPRGGLMHGVPGHPYTHFDSITYTTRCEVNVTAKWGWPEVPAPVRSAALVLAAETFKLKDSPSGVAGFGEFGIVRVREIPHVHRLLAPYRIRMFVA